MTAVAVNETVTDDQLDQFAKLIYARAGVRISPQKKTLLSNRLRRRLRATGLATFDDYYRRLTTVGAADAEWDAFLQEITTHETYLFRDPGQWEWFCDTYLPELERQARNGERKRSLRIWSAASSTGDEAHTIGCCIADRLKNLDQWKVEIVGTDIGLAVVEEAREGCFRDRAMQHVPDSHRRRFFSQRDDGLWEASPRLTNWMTFRPHNLLEPLLAVAFDLVFVKNVLIYFDADSKKRVFANVDNALKPGGTLVTGPAEGISDLLKVYERVFPWQHRKPDLLVAGRQGTQSRAS